MARSAVTSPRATRSRRSRSRARSLRPAVTAATTLFKHPSILGARITRGSGAPHANEAMFCLSYGPPFTSDVYVLNFSDEEPLRFPGGGRMRFKTFLKRLYQEYENDAVA